MKKEYGVTRRASNVYVGGYSNFEKYSVSEYNSIPVELSTSDGNNLMKYISQEGAYFNSIVKSISPLIRTSKEDIEYVFKNYKNLIIAISSIGFKITPTRYKKIELPEAIKSFDKVIYEKNDKNEYVINVRIANILDCVTGNGSILTGMRSNIAYEVLKHTVNQIHKMNEIFNEDSEEIVYKKSIELLEEIDLNSKNSLQLTKKCFKLEYFKNEETDEEYTKVILSFTKEPIIIKNVNLIKNNNWNLLILKYFYGKDNKIHWVASTRKLKSNYMVKSTTLKRKR